MTENKSTTFVANLDKAPGLIGTYVAVVNKRQEAANEIVRANSANSQTVESIAKDLAATSNDPKIIAARERIAKEQAALEAHFLAEAEKVKAAAGEPDVIAESNAKGKVKAALGLLVDELADNGLSLADVEHFLVEPAKGKRHIGGGVASGPRNDVTAIREWARKNGFDVKDKGRMSDEILTAYNEAHGTAE